MPKSIILIGPPGAGKTVCGQALAQRLGWHFVDTDRQIEQATGKAVSLIFREDGEPHFRQLETQLLQQLSSTTENPMVIASGGGMPATPGNFTLLQALGVVIYLLADEQTLVDRLDRGQIRPLLSGVHGEQADAIPLRLKNLLAKRKAIYEQADHQVETSSCRPDEVVEQILKLLR